MFKINFQDASVLCFQSGVRVGTILDFIQEKYKFEGVLQEKDLTLTLLPDVITTKDAEYNFVENEIARKKRKVEEESFLFLFYFQ